MPRDHFVGPPSRRAGFSLVEIVIAMTIMLAVFAMAVPFFRVQARTVTDYGGRFDAQANARFAFNTIERELRVAGVGVLNEQPLIVQADSFAITFNGDYATTDQQDASATYYNPSLSTTVTTALGAASQVTLPRSGGRVYPSRSYTSGFGADVMNSVAETISFWVSRDSTSPDSLHILFRRVNGAAPQVVARNLLIDPAQPMFRYYRIVADTLHQISPGSLPLYHVATHGAATDTGAVAWIDSIRVVRFSVTSVHRDPARGLIHRRVEGNVRLLNAGLVNNPTCGDRPFGSTLTATNAPILNFGDPPGVLLTWPASVDQASGEKDAERYVLYRRLVGVVDWGEPIASLPASSTTYTYTDYDVLPGQQVQYALVVQDCTPASSDVSTSTTVTIP